MKKSNKKVIFRILLSVLLVLFLEIIAFLFIQFQPNRNTFFSSNFKTVRLMLMAQDLKQEASRYLTLPYLNYSPNPGYKGHSYIGLSEAFKKRQIDKDSLPIYKQHNTQGYRGKATTVKKNDSYRILCMGGSTTYGTGVYKPDESYPAQLETILNEWLKTTEISAKISNFEVINAGLEDGNSADELAHYLFKYRYYKPDMVILHSVGNDAMIDYTDPAFQPDYTKYRRRDFHLKPLPSQSRWMMHSHFLSAIIIYLFYSDFEQPHSRFTRTPQQTYIDWFDSDLLNTEKANFYIPFYQNHRQLLHAIKSDSAIVINLSFALNPKDTFVISHPDYVERVNSYNRFAKNISLKLENVFHLAYKFDSIPEGMWYDDCHLNSDGEKIKAKMVSKKVKQILNL